MKRLLNLISAVLFGIAIFNGGQSLFISAKAELAQFLLDKAWDRSLVAGSSERAWPWADAKPIARLVFPHNGEEFVVLDNASGEALAFGPGLVHGNWQAVDQATLAIGGHRDTHLQLLENLPENATIRLQTLDSNWHEYRASRYQVVDTSIHGLALNNQRKALVLITCFPFSAAQTGGPLRYVLTALPV